MTENLLQKLEEKMMILVSELEEARKEIENARKKIQHLTNENELLKGEQDHHGKKVQDLISLLDAVNITEPLLVNSALQTVKPVLVQG